MIKIENDEEFAAAERLFKSLQAGMLAYSEQLKEKQHAEDRRKAEIENASAPEPDHDFSPIIGPIKRARMRLRLLAGPGCTSVSREAALAATKLDEAEMWVKRHIEREGE